MQYRIGAGGEKVSALGFGCMRLPQKNGMIDKEKAKLLVRNAIENGINYFDTAVFYHNGASETFLGEALSEGLRDKVYIATKLPHWVIKSRKDMENTLNSQLRKLKTDHIDYYLLHSIDTASWNKLKALGVKDFIGDAKKSGMIRHIGFSFHGSRDSFKEILDDYDWEFCQIQYNYLDEHNQAGREGLEYAGIKGIPVIIMEGLRGGMLAAKLPREIDEIFNAAESKKTPAEWSLRWIWNHPEVSVVLSGMNEQEQLDENIQIAKTALPNSLNKSELDTIGAVKDKLNEIVKVKCTGCRYCMPCPHNVNIPDCFATYNEYSLFDHKRTVRIQYIARTAGLLTDRSNAGLCKKCKKCVKHCPQKIDIPTELTHVSRTMEGAFFIIATLILSPIMKIHSKISLMKLRKRK